MTAYPDGWVNAEKVNPYYPAQPLGGKVGADTKTVCWRRPLSTNIINIICEIDECDYVVQCLVFTLSQGKPAADLTPSYSGYEINKTPR